MTRIRNDTNATLDFIVGPAKDGVPQTDHVSPGETKDIAVDENDATFKGRVIAGAIAVVGGRAAKEK